MTEATPPARPRTFSCPHCGGTVDLRAMGISVTAVCKGCGSIIDVTNDNYKIIAEAAVKTHRTRIPMGARGVFFGTTWEAIGYTGMSDGTGNYLWAEYLLFNPYQGFRFLVEDEGHWNFVTMQRRYIGGAGAVDSVHLDGRNYRIFNRGDAIVQYVMGEFYWRVHVKDRSHVADYVSAPYMLSMEQSGSEIVWSRGVYIPSQEIYDAFGLATKAPIQNGVGANQPAPGAESYGKTWQMAFIFFALIFVVQTALGNRASTQEIYRHYAAVTPSNKGQILLAEPVDVPEGKGNLEIIGHSAVNNNWVEIYGSLVNDATQESDDFLLPIEYYYGWDSDGNWTEGSHTARETISRVAGGHYQLVVEADAGALARGGDQDFDIRIIRGAPMWENFWWAICLLLAWPLCLMIRRWYFETQRWQKSDFSPHASKTGD